MPISAFLFDLDGTLIDSSQHVIDCFQHAWRTVLGHTLPIGTITATFGIPLEQAIRSLEPQHADALLSAYRKESGQRGDSDITMIPGADATLAELKNRGAKCAVVTSKKRVNAMRSLDAFGLSPYMDAFIGPEDTPHHKPDPHPAILALKALDAAPKQAVMIGDSPHDIACGQAAGTYTCGVAFAQTDLDLLQKSGPTWMIKQLNDLIPLYGTAP